MLRVAGESNTTGGVAVYESQRLISQETTQERLGFPWRTVESAVAIVLVLLVMSLPVATVEVGGFTRSVTIWSAISFLLDMVAAGVGASGTLALVIVLFALLAVGVGSMVDTVVVCNDDEREGNAIPTSWGMVVFGMGMTTVFQLAESQVAVGTLGFETLCLGPAIAAALVGGIACGALDLVRAYIKA